MSGRYKSDKFRGSVSKWLTECWHNNNVWDICTTTTLYTVDISLSPGHRILLSQCIKNKILFRQQLSACYFLHVTNTTKSKKNGFSIHVLYKQKGRTKMELFKIKCRVCQSWHSLYRTIDAKIILLVCLSNRSTLTLAPQTYYVLL